MRPNQFTRRTKLLESYGSRRQFCMGQSQQHDIFNTPGKRNLHLFYELFRQIDILPVNNCDVSLICELIEEFVCRHLLNNSKQRPTIWTCMSFMMYHIMWPKLKSTLSTACKKRYWCIAKVRLEHFHRIIHSYRSTIS